MGNSLRLTVQIGATSLLAFALASGSYAATSPRTNFLAQDESKANPSARQDSRAGGGQSAAGQDSEDRPRGRPLENSRTHQELSTCGATWLHVFRRWKMLPWTLAKVRS